MMILKHTATNSKSIVSSLPVACNCYPKSLTSILLSHWTRLISCLMLNYVYLKVYGVQPGIKWNAWFDDENCRVYVGQASNAHARNITPYPPGAGMPVHHLCLASDIASCPGQGQDYHTSLVSAFRITPEFHKVWRSCFAATFQLLQFGLVVLVQELGGSDITIETARKILKFWSDHPIREALCRLFENLAGKKIKTGMKVVHNRSVANPPSSIRYFRIQKLCTQIERFSISFQKKSSKWLLWRWMRWRIFVEIHERSHQRWVI